MSIRLLFYGFLTLFFGGVFSFLPDIRLSLRVYWPEIYEIISVHWVLIGELLYWLGFITMSLGWIFLGRKVVSRLFLFSGIILFIYSLSVVSALLTDIITFYYANIAIKTSPILTNIYKVYSTYYVWWYRYGTYIISCILLIICLIKTSRIYRIQYLRWSGITRSIGLILYLIITTLIIITYPYHLQLLRGHPINPFITILYYIVMILANFLAAQGFHKIK